MKKKKKKKSDSMFQNQSLGPSTSSKTPKLTAPHMGFVFGSLINRGSLLFFFTVV